MPPSPAILAASLGVTFVGPNDIPQKTMPGFLYVNCLCVHDALQWLKEHNLLYKDIEISLAHLNALLVNTVPPKIFRVTQHWNDNACLSEERDDYVPEEIDEDSDSESVDDCIEWNCSFLIDADEAVIPLQALGVVDVTANDVPDEDVLAHALVNVTCQEKQEGWVIRWSSDFVNEYACKNADGVLSDGAGENPNHLLGSFPCLFPYGMGGFEVNRKVTVSYKSHACWALCYNDKCFHKDMHFMFQTFGVLQKRHLCSAAALQVSQPAFIRNKQVIRTLHSSDFDIAAAKDCSCAVFFKSNYEKYAAKYLFHSVKGVRNR
ncbi:hypothetical protein EI94DRAFT_1815860 [Lactarius quietus]|nr:hypothetical protein EI94DRAFT_1815860 [Lactarius quietus]